MRTSSKLFEAGKRCRSLESPQKGDKRGLCERRAIRELCPRFPPFSETVNFLFDLQLCSSFVYDTQCIVDVSIKTRVGSRTESNWKWKLGLGLRIAPAVLAVHWCTGSRPHPSRFLIKQPEQPDIAMPLLDLPSELLTLIAHHIGPVELRTSTAYLLVSKLWYRAALPVFLSELQLSTLRLCSRQLEPPPIPNSPVGTLLAAEVKRLSIRLVGHPSEKIARWPWHDEEPSDDVAGNQDEYPEECEDWTIVGPQKLESRWRRDCYDWEIEMELQLRPWSERINKGLTSIISMLPDFKSLEELSIEARSHYEATWGPRWDYLSYTPIRSMMANISPSLTNLTLDTCGSNLVLPREHADAATSHICPFIAQQMHQVENVRLRMRCICPLILDSSPAPSGQNSRLRTLVIRLSLPFYPEAAHEKHNGHTEYDAQPCTPSAMKKPLYKAMVAAGLRMARTNPEVQMLRVSYRDPRSSGINLMLADCVRRVYMYEPSEIFSYEDEGKEWDAWEHNETLRDGGAWTDRN